ncbi:MAG: hypothetical protein BGO77_01940 [Caedibacter sp. 37-49]|nr:MAG: hypothetical protein BGO77_01940 [Caedibacter sp. 37-49]
MVSQKGVNASYLFDNEKPEQGKTQPYQKKANKSYAKGSGQKRLYAKRDSQQSIAEFFIRSKRPKTDDTATSNTSLSSSTNSSVDLTLDDFDKENNPSLAQESMSHAKATPEEITAFKKLFSPTAESRSAPKKRVKPLAPVQPQTPKSSPEELEKFKKLFLQPSKVDYEAIKAEKLTADWDAENGNSVMFLGKWETPSNKSYRIVVTKWVNPKDYSEIKYSAFINGTSLSHWLQKPYWFRDQDSVKRAAINIIYNNK